MNESQNTINICMGSSCSARGNARNLELIRAYLAEKNLEDRVTLSGALCQGLCKEGPNLAINGKNFSGVDPNNLIDLLDHHFGR